MDLDPLSPVVAARIKILLVPTGHVKWSRFASFVHRLRQENTVRLGDVSPDSRPHRTIFSPLAFPEGKIVFDLSTSLPPSSHLALAPFELYRQPLLVLGVKDGEDVEVRSIQADTTDRMDKRHGRMVAEDDLNALSHDLQHLKSSFPMALVHHILVFDCLVDLGGSSEGLVFIPPLVKSRTTTIKTVMCDLTSSLLAEMTSYARSLQAMSSLDTPKLISDPSTSHEIASSIPAHMNAASRPPLVGRPRSFSPNGDASHPSSRISMPAHLPSNANSYSSAPESRNSSPAPGPHTPSTIETNGVGQVTLPYSKSSNEAARGESHDRVSATGFGPGSLGERERNKGKMRTGVIVGAMYLLVGQWPDAMKELVQSATAARATGDYVWQAKALDYIMVCLLMCAWAGVDFRIPDILRPGSERSSTGSSNPSNNAHSTGLPFVMASNTLDPGKRDLNLQSLATLLPDLVNTMTNLYSRAWTFTDDKIPPLVFSHSTIRFAKLLAAVHSSHGFLNEDVLNYFVLNKQLPQRAIKTADIASLPSKPEIVALLLRAHPSSWSDTLLTAADRTNILAAIASLLSDLGHQRKKALILKELMSALLPALVQARKDGAAEMGVHPAASLASLDLLSGNSPTAGLGLEQLRSEQGMRDFLLLVCQSYGIDPSNTRNQKGYTWNREETQPSTASSTSIHPHDESLSAILQQASRNVSGPQELKIDILRSCINICEALPDLAGALQYSAELLRTAGSCTAPGPENSNGSPALPIEEQVRLANNISRTLSAAQHLGLTLPEAEYWDEFLVRGIEITDVSPSRSLTSHAKSELELVETIESKQEKDPFIYNPFLKSNSSATVDTLLVAKEEAVFRLILQNLYDFDLTIERIKIDADGVPFVCPTQATTIGPYRTQTILIGCTPMTPGSLKIRGCMAKIRGCRERTFSIFGEPWALKADVKGKNLRTNIARLPGNATEPVKLKPSLASEGPKAAMLALTVIESQPTVTLKSISLPQSAVMLLEGETKRFTVALQNVSRTTPVDLLLLSFTDSTAAQIRAAISSKELSAPELYELELASVHNPSFRWHRKEEHRDIKIAAGGEVTVEIEVRGNAGLSYGTIQIDYGHLGIPKAEIQGRFYTRQLIVPLTVTVNSSIDLVRNDIVPFAHGFNSQQQNQQSGNPDTLASEKYFMSQPSLFTQPNEVETFLSRLGLSSTTTHALLLLDFRNSWPCTLTLTLNITPSSTDPSTSFTTSHSVNPGSTIRLPIPIPQIYLPPSTSHALIPSLNQAKKRQFVVSAAKQTPEWHRALRESFWYRETLLKTLTATWKEEDTTTRTGSIDMRALKINPRMISAYKLDDLAISMRVAPSSPPTYQPNPIQPPPPPNQTNTFHTPTLHPLTLHTTLRNRSPSPIHPLLRLQPALANQPHNIALDLSKKLLVSGVQQMALPQLNSDEETEVETAFVVLAAGVYEWGAVVEEVGGGMRRGGGEGVAGRKRALTGEVEVGEFGRRRWVGRGCVVVARGESGEAELGL